MIPDLLWLVAGAAVALVNAVTRRKAVASLSAESVSGSLVLALGSMLLRLGLIAALLVVALSHGIVSGLLAFGGLWLTRAAIVLWIGVGWSDGFQRIQESSND